MFLLAAMLVVGGFIGGAVTYSKVHDDVAGPSISSQKAEQKISDALDSLEQVYVDPVTQDGLVDAAIEGMVESVDDPYTRYLNKTGYEDMQRVTSGSYQGVGISIGPKKGKIVVSTVYDGTPADKAGLESGDEIAKINDKSAKGMTVEDAVSIIRGKPGTKVKLEMHRPGDGNYVRTIVRNKITIPNVVSKMEAKDIGYIELLQFNQTSGEDLRQHIKKVTDKGAKAIILDLRGNPGGLLDQAVSVSSIFLNKGLVVVSTKPRAEPKSELKATGNPISSDIPLVVLINRGSASASEIVAGAIQDHERGMIVGTRSFGKASVQQVVPLRDGSAMVITTAHYFTPDGTNIAKKGIQPNVKVQIADKAAKGTAKGKKAKEDEDSPHVPKNRSEDTQLDKAVEILREKLK